MKLFILISDWTFKNEWNELGLSAQGYTRWFWFFDSLLGILSIEITASAQGYMNGMPIMIIFENIGKLE